MRTVSKWETCQCQIINCISAPTICTNIESERALYIVVMATVASFCFSIKIAQIKEVLPFIYKKNRLTSTEYTKLLCKGSAPLPLY